METKIYTIEITSKDPYDTREKFEFQTELTKEQFTKIVSGIVAISTQIENQ